MPVVFIRSIGINFRRRLGIHIRSRCRFLGNCINLMGRISQLIDWGRQNRLKAKLIALISLWLLIACIFGGVRLLHYNEVWHSPFSIEGIPASLGSTSGNN